MTPWAGVAETHSAAVFFADDRAVTGRALSVIRPHGAEHVWRPLRPYTLPG